MQNISNLFYFRTTLHVLDGLSVHHQESKSVHTASEVYIQSQTPGDERSDRPKLVECCSKIK